MYILLWAFFIIFAKPFRSLEKLTIEFIFLSLVPRFNFVESLGRSGKTENNFIFSLTCTAI